MTRSLLQLLDEMPPDATVPVGWIREKVGRELADWWRGWWMEALTVHDAARFGGYSERQLYDGLRTGDIPNAGTNGRKLILRRNIPVRGLPAHRLVPDDTLRLLTEEGE